MQRIIHLCPANLSCFRITGTNKSRAFSEKLEFKVIHSIKWLIIYRFSIRFSDKLKNNNTLRFFI